MSEGPAARALREALKALGVPAPQIDKAAMQLAKRYAALLDEATPASKYRPHLDKLARAVSRNAEAAEALERIRDALGAHSVLSDLGPKYLATLDRLGLTPAARGSATPAGAPNATSKRDDLKARRDARSKRAGSSTG